MRPFLCGKAGRVGHSWPAAALGQAWGSVKEPLGGRQEQHGGCSTELSMGAKGGALAWQVTDASAWRELGKKE